MTKRNNRKSSIKPPGGDYFKHIWGLRGGLFQTHLRVGGGLNREGGLIWEEALFNLAKTMVSVLHKELGYKVEKFN